MTAPLHAPTLDLSREGGAADSERVLDEAIEAAWARISPLWTLKSFVAVNPYGGFVEQPFGEAARAVDRLFHARATMPLAYYQSRYLDGAFDDADLERARRERPSVGSAQGRCYTYVELLDRRRDTDWSRVVVEELAKWCAARFDQGQAAWTQPGRDAPVWPGFKQCAALDKSPELRGLEGFRAYVRGLPDDPRAVIRRVLEQLEVPAWAWPDFLSRALATVRGWAGHVRFRAREAALRGKDDGDERVGLLAARIAFEGAAHAAREHAEESWPRLLATHLSPDDEERDALPDALSWQDALERGYRRALAARLASGPSPTVAVGAPTLQAAFCIDVRSEVFRRHLEQASARVQTIGFAGFFGFGLEWQPLAEGEGGARCPALIAPAHRIRQAPAEGSGLSPEAAERRRRTEHARHRLGLSTRLSSVSSFSFAETAGAWYAIRLLTDALGLTCPQADGGYFPSRIDRALAPEIDVQGATGLGLDTRVQLAEGALRGMGLLDDFAEIVLLCGHGSRTSNNPYGSGLDCGACGGHAGDLNAKVAAKVLNDPEVRRELRARGIDVPSSTRFVAGLHETTTDQVELFDVEDVRPELLEQVRAWLRTATEKTRRERLARMRGGDDAEPEAEVRRRSRDWSEVRPEWGLARNAAFVAARRARTRGVDLDGRVFLHDYDAEKDPEGAVLESIMTAPMVVAHWINMQYYASTVDNEAFGSGNKALHNVVSRHGVQLGNRSDLQVGLPFQSVHDGEAPYHEPIRLQVVIEAEAEALDAVLEAHPNVRALVDNGWITLMAWRPRADDLLRRRPGGQWTPVL